MTNYLTNTKGYMIHYSHEYLYTCEYSIFITTWIFNTFINNHDYLQIFQKLDFIIVFMIKLPLEFNNKYHTHLNTYVQIYIH
jgi:low affinity Fe/Cu permease